MKHVVSESMNHDQDQMQLIRRSHFELAVHETPAATLMATLPAPPSRSTVVLADVNVAG